MYKSGLTLEYNMVFIRSERDVAGVWAEPHVPLERVSIISLVKKFLFPHHHHKTDTCTSTSCYKDAKLDNASTQFSRKGSGFFHDYC